jgi:hypothetical protein
MQLSRRPPVPYSGSASLAVGNKMLPKKPGNARVKIAVKFYPVEARHVGANARYGRRQFRRAGRQECKVAGWYGVNVRFARQAVCDASIARTVAHAWAPQFGSPVLEGDLDGGQIIPRKNGIRRIDNNRGLDTCIMWQVGRSFPVVKLLTSSRLVLANLASLPKSGVTPISTKPV